MTEANETVTERSNVPVPAPTPTPAALKVSSAPSRRPPRARPYLRLLWIIPAAAVFAVGLWGMKSVVPTGSGSVERIKLTTKAGPVGQAAEALRLVTGTYDIYLTIRTPGGRFVTPVKEKTAMGNGLKWGLDDSYKLEEIRQIDVWDKTSVPFRSDKNLDHINIEGQWSAEGQTFRIDLIGNANEDQPPRWALPTLSVGATLTVLVFLRFVWDQVV